MTVSRHLPPIPTQNLSPSQHDILQSGLLTSGFNCILQMPTGSGKTWLAEQAIAHTLHQGQRAIYLTPLRALADELCQRWQKSFAPHPVGVFTGDYAHSRYPVSYQDARLFVMTPEKLDACTRNWRSHWSWLPDVDLVVVDEFHLLGDSHRGARLEGTLLRLMRLNPFIRVLGLSATLGNRHELTQWLNGVDYVSYHRPIPLEWSVVRYKRAEDKPHLLQRELERNLATGGKSLVFVQSRRRAEAIAHQLQEDGLNASHHHAGLEPKVRRHVENAFRNGDLDILIATATLEMGLNLPVRQVVLYDLQGFDGQDFVPLSVISVWQRAGRAGRPGLDACGEVVLLTPTWSQLPPYAQGHFEPIQSQIGHPTFLSEQIIAEIASGLSLTESQLTVHLNQSLAAHQGLLKPISKTLNEMMDAGMLVLDQSTSSPRLRATRIGYIAVRHLLLPETVLLFKQTLETIADLSFLDLLILAASSGDCQPQIPVDFELLDLLSDQLSQEPSYFLSLGRSHLVDLLKLDGKRLLTAIYTALSGRMWTRFGSAEKVAETYGCYSFEVERLSESLQRLLAAMGEICAIAQGQETPDDSPSLKERIQVLEKMVASGLDEQAVTLTLLPGLGATLAKRLNVAGIDDIEMLALSDVEELQAVPGIGHKRAATWLRSAEELVDGQMSAFRYREEISVANRQTSTWPKDVDPYRLRRSLDLKITGQDGNVFRISGGLDPHTVQFRDGNFHCDCADFAKGHICKHILWVRLFRGDTQLRQWVELLATESVEQPVDVYQLWWGGNG